MPIKVRCSGCEKVLNAPTGAAGKALKCPQCGSRVKVPVPKAGGGKRSAARKPVRQRKTSNTAGSLEDNENFWEDLDLDTVEDQEVKLCPKCGAELKEDAVECPECGVDPRTGKLSERVRKKRSRRGPDPAEFYKVAFPSSYQFVMRNRHLVWKTGFNISFYGFLSMMSFAFATDFFGFFPGDGETPPGLTLPPKVFWIGFGLLCMAGMLGWLVVLNREVIKTTMAKKDEIRKVNTDFTQCISAGLGIVFWPALLMIPVLVVLIPLMFFTGFTDRLIGPEASLSLQIITGSGFLFFPVFMLPAAMVHFTIRHKYPALNIWDMLRVFVKNVPATFFYWVVAIGVLIVSLIPVVLVLVMLYALLAWYTESSLMDSLKLFLVPIFNAEISTATVKITTWLLNLMGEQPKEDTFFFGSISFPMRLGFCLMFFVIPATLMAFPALFMMRVNGLFGYYNQMSLDLVTTRNPEEPAGFWVRSLAAMTDLCCFPLASILVVKNPQALMVGWLLNLLGVGSLLLGFPPIVKIVVWAGLWPLYNAWMYFALQEGGPDQTTIGKDAFGLMVVKENGKPLNIQDATKRYFMKFGSAVPLGFGFIMAGFDPQKRAMHDRLAHTRVIFRGDGEDLGV